MDIQQALDNAIENLTAWVQGHEEIKNLFVLGFIDKNGNLRNEFSFMNDWRYLLIAMTKILNNGTDYHAVWEEKVNDLDDGWSGFMFGYIMRHVQNNIKQNLGISHLQVIETENEDDMNEIQVMARRIKKQEFDNMPDEQITVISQDGVPIKMAISQLAQHILDEVRSDNCKLN